MPGNDSFRTDTIWFEKLKDNRKISDKIKARLEVVNISV
jgi:hypothetical protein